MSGADNASVSGLEMADLAIIYGISRLRPPRIFKPVATSLLSGINAKYQDQRVGRFFFKKYFGISVGKYSYGFVQLMLTDLHMVRSIGAFCSFADGLVVSNGNHPINRLTSHPSAYDAGYGFVSQTTPEGYYHPKNKPVDIGSDVWIGQNVFVLTSVTIGSGAVIGAGSVVTRCVPPYAIVAGNPARIIKYRFSEGTINFILESRWWDRSDEDIRKIFTELSYSRIASVSENHESEIVSCLEKMKPLQKTACNHKNL